MKHGLRIALLLVILGHFALGLQFSLHNPLGEAPDEADHWAYVVYLAQTGELPVGPQLTQGKHPPLYHIGAALFAALGEPSADFFHPNPAVNLTPGPEYSPNFFLHETEVRPWRGAILSYHIARLWSLVLTTLTVAATAALARAAFPALPWLGVAGAGMLAFLPEFLFLAGALSNDTAAALCGALALWGALAIYRSGGLLRYGWWTPLALGAGVLAKVSSVALWPIAGLALLFGMIAKDSPKQNRATADDGHEDQVGTASWFSLRRQWRAILWRGLLLYVPALLIIAPWLYRNQRLYGDLMGMNMALQTIDQRTAPWLWADTQWLLRGWFFSFWGKFGGAGHIPMPDWAYWIAGAILLVAFVGIIRWWLRGNWIRVRLPLVLLALAPLGVGASMARYSLIALGTDQGRLLFPAAAAIMLLVAGGLLAWLPRRAQPHVTGVVVLGMAALSIFALWGVLLPAFR